MERGTVKVLLISENRCRDNIVPWPIGAAFVSAAAKAGGHDVLGLDLMFSDDPEGESAAAAALFKPDCIGLSIRNIDNQDMRSSEFFLAGARRVVEAVRRETRAPVVPGGPGFSIFPLECLDYFDLELGVVGEGERSFPALLDSIGEEADPGELPGLAVRRPDRRCVNPPPVPVDLASVPLPDREAFDVSRYKWVPGRGRPCVTSVQSRRGCHMRCIYCSSPIVEGKVVRRRDPGWVADELEALVKDHGMKAVAFADSNFNYPLEYTLELCARIAARRLPLKWSCIVNPRWFDDELIPVMREAGCFAVSLGNESGSEETLSTLRKGFSTRDVRRVATAVKGAGMSLGCFLLLGGPGETRRSVDESIALMDELGPDTVRVTVGIRIFPGCELEEIARERGMLTPGENLLYPSFYLEPGVRPWLPELIKSACASRRGWFL